MHKPISARNEEGDAQTERESAKGEGQPKCSTKSSAEDLIECSKELLDSLNKALEKEKRHFSLSGEFLSKSLEDIHLVSRAPVAIFDGRLIESKNEKKNIQFETNEIMMEDYGLPMRTIPEGCIKGWAAEIILCLAKFHSCGLIYGYVRRISDTSNFI